MKTQSLSFRMLAAGLIFLSAVTCRPCEAQLWRTCQDAIVSFFQIVFVHRPPTPVEGIHRRTHELNLLRLEAENSGIFIPDPREYFVSALKLATVWEETGFSTADGTRFATFRTQDRLYRTHADARPRVRTTLPDLLALSPTRREELITRLGDTCLESCETFSWMPDAWLRNVVGYHVVYYTALDNRVYQTFRLKRTLGETRVAQYLLPPEPRHLPAILEDISRRMVLAREAYLAGRPEVFREQLATALYGYYFAYPYDLGTLEIGTAIFEGFFRAIVGGEIKMFPRAGALFDMVALSKRAFVERVTILLKEASLESRR